MLFSLKSFTTFISAAALLTNCFLSINADAAWSPTIPITVTPAGLNPTPSALAIDNSSNAIIGWLQSNPFVDEELFTSSLNANALSWNTPIPLYTGIPPQYAIFPIMFSSGNTAIPAWAIFNTNANPDAFELAINQQPTLTTSWPAPYFGQTVNGFPAGGAGSCDEFGNLLLIQASQPSLFDSSPPYPIFYMTKREGTGITSTVDLALDYGPSRPSANSSTANGHGVMAWKVRSSTAALSIETANFAFSTNTLGPIIEAPLPPGATDINNIHLYLAPSGNAVLVYGAQFGSGNFVLYYSFRPKGMLAWSTPVSFSNPLNITEDGALSIDGDSYGNVNILWPELSPLPSGFFRTAYLPFGGTISTVTDLTSSLDPNSFGTGSQGIINVDSFGNAVAVWQLLVGGTAPTVQVSDKPVGGAWSTPYSFTTDGAFPLIALSDQGSAVATWLSPSGDPEPLQSSVNNYLFPLHQPQAFTAKLVKNRFATQTAFGAKLSWLPSLGGGISYYTLLKDGQFLATIPGSGPFTYTDHLRANHITSTYTITATATNGNVSVPVNAVVVSN